MVGILGDCGVHGDSWSTGRAVPTKMCVPRTFVEGSGANAVAPPGLMSRYPAADQSSQSGGICETSSEGLESDGVSVVMASSFERLPKIGRASCRERV